jgi:hypothetical protein
MPYFYEKRFSVNLLTKLKLVEEDDTMIVTANGLVSVPKIDLEFGPKKEQQNKSSSQGRIFNGKTPGLAEMGTPPLENNYPWKFPNNVRQEIRFPENILKKGSKENLAVQWSDNSVDSK